ncbi:MAG: hypoxanthine phosphoribosyltransferase [Thermodesulfobacteriota bacterium]|nr:hypoxanthine phosphoribosyltransferase [Thermodesulfobacteriota bacterium]
MDKGKKRILFDAETISARVKELGKAISADYPQGNLVMVGLLKGSFIFLADLVRTLEKPCQIDFARISSYGSGTVSSGQLEVVMDIVPVTGRDVILVDDIVDSGLTLDYYRKRVEQFEPRSLKTAALIDKTGRRDRDVHLDYYGFRIEDGFVVGYGLDWDERFRNLSHIYVLDES